MAEASLPQSFSDLAAIVEWSLPTETARAAHRRTRTFDELKAFYDVMKLRVVEALTYLDQFSLDNLPDAEQRLFNICLSYAEVAPFIEQYNRVVVPESFDEARFVPVHDLPQRARR